MSATIDESVTDQSHPGPPTRKAFFLLSGIVLLISIGLLVYSQTMAFVWDEGFHLVAAQLINAGKTPYLDFCFAQTPLNAYWNAAWMQVFGETWRVTHVPAALLVIGSLFLIADFVLARFPVPQWRLPCAICVAFFVGLNTMVVEFGPIAQAYAMGLFLSVASFRLAIVAVRHSSALWPFAAGLLAGAAADSTLLTAPVVPVLLIWMLVYNRVGNRSTKSAAFLGAVLISFAPVIWLFSKTPRIVFFDIVQYQALYRRADWPGVNTHDVDVLSDWLVSTQAFLMGCLGIAGVLFARKSNWDRERRAEFLLCAWLAAALAVFIATAHPTFARYFVFIVPFLSVTAAIGIYAACLRIGISNRPLGPVFVITLLVTLALAKALFDDRDATTWKVYERIAAKIDQVTPRNGTLFADELVYFILHRIPPSGMEFSYSHKVELPPAQSAALHIVSLTELEKEIKAGKFDTVESCNDDKIDDFGLPKLFAHRDDIEDCSIFWGKIPAATASQAALKK